MNNENTKSYQENNGLGRRFNTSEASQYLGGHPTAGTLEIWRSSSNKGKVVFVRIGRRVFYYEKHLDDFLKLALTINPSQNQNHKV